MNKPLDIKKVNVSIENIERRIINDSILFQPSGNIGLKEAATKGIAMILSDVQLPTIFVTEDRNGIQTVQNNGALLYAIYQFVLGVISLSETTIIDGINNKKFDELCNKDQNKIYNTVMVFNRCLLGSNPSETDLKRVKSLLEDIQSIAS